MKDKSHVSLEQHVCMVCGQPFDTGSLLLDRRLKPTLAPRTPTGWGLCPQHQKLSDQGFIALIECDLDRSGAPSAGERLKPEQMQRTGRLAFVKRAVFSKIFDTSIMANQPCVFVEAGLIERIETMVASAAR